jgi:hypothetical protein
MSRDENDATGMLVVRGQGHRAADSRLIAVVYVDLLDLDAALGKLATIERRLGRLVVLRFFGGMTVEKTRRGSRCVSGNGQV